MARSQLHGRVSFEMFDKKKSQITYNVHDIGKSDLVIFHARDVQSYERTKEIQQIHNYRCPQQRMAFFNQ